MSDALYMRLDDAVKRVNLLCKWEFGKDCTFDETILRQELEQICQIPSPVEVVRCKDCKYKERKRCGLTRYSVCGLTRYTVRENDYCSYGERKDDE
jgi:hypothetical protein